MPGGRLVVVRSFNGQWMDGKAFAASVSAHRRSIRSQDVITPEDNERLVLLNKLYPEKISN